MLAAPNKVNSSKEQRDAAYAGPPGNAMQAQFSDPLRERWKWDGYLKGQTGRHAVILHPEGQTQAPVIMALASLSAFPHRVRSTDSLYCTG
jgi:hypothetical protein